MFWSYDFCEKTKDVIAKAQQTHPAANFFFVSLDKSPSKGPVMWNAGLCLTKKENIFPTILHRTYSSFFTLGKILIIMNTYLIVLIFKTNRVNFNKYNCIL